MALPTTISSVALPSNTWRSEPIKSAGGAFYVVVLDSADATQVEVHKATDPTSSFSEQDSGNKPTGSTNNIVALAVCQSGDKIHIATQQDGSGTPDVEYHVFDMATDSWSTTNDAVVSPPDAGTFNTPKVAIKARSSDFVIFYYSTAKLHGTDWGRTMAAHGTAGSWTVDVEIDDGSGNQEHHNLQAVAKGDGTNYRLHVLWYMGTGSPELRVRTLRSDNSLSSVTATGEGMASSINNAGISYDASGTQTVGFAWKSSTSLVGYIEAADADSPSWGSRESVATINVRTTSIDVSGTAPILALAEDGNGTVYALLVDNADSDLVAYTGPGTWSYDSDVVVGTVNRVAANRYSRGGSDVIAYLYDDGGTVKYNEISLGAGSQTGVATPAAASWTVPNVTVSVGPVTAAATPAAATWAVPNATGGVSQTAQATPAVASWAVPAATAVPGTVSAGVTPAAASWAVPAATAALGAVTATATPAAASWAVTNVTVSGAQVGVVAPAAATWTVPNATAVPGAVTRAATPAAATWVAPAVTAVATYGATVTPAAATWSVPVATAAVGAVTAQATPATASWSVPSAIAASATTLQATPAAASWNVPAAVAQITVSVSAAPASASWAVTSASAIVGAVSAQASPAAASWSVPAASGSVVQIAAATPAVASWSVPTVTVALGALIALASPAVATWAVPGVTAVIPIPDALLLEVLINGVWEDRTPDVLGYRQPTRFNRGISGSTPFDVMADVGGASFVFDNSEYNDEGLIGRYSPGHPNHLAGFHHGTLVRIKLRAGGGVSKYWWRGRIRRIKPDFSIHGERGCLVVCEDWFAELQDLDDLQLSLRTNVTVGTALADLVALVERAPSNTDYATGSDTLSFIYDDLGSVTTGTNVAQGLMQTERGKLFTRGDDTDGETLVFEDRNADALKSVADSFDGSEIKFEPGALDVPSELDLVFNNIAVVVFPREIGPNNDQVLVKLQAPEQVLDGEVPSIFADYRDPNQRAVFVGAQNGQQPVGNTDFTANSAEDGSGSDVTADFTVTATFFGSTILLQPERTTGSGTAYIRGPSSDPGMQARAQGLFRYAPITLRNDLTATAIDESIAKFGERPLPHPFEMPYQSDRNVGQGVADQIANIYAGAGNIPSRVRLLTENDDVLQRALALDIGDKIQITEAQTGVMQANVIIRSIEVEIPGHGHPAIWFGLSPADTSSALVLDHPNAGTIGNNALAFG